MKVLIVSEHEHSAVDQVMRTIAAKSRHDVDVKVRALKQGLDACDGYDLVHVGWHGLMQRANTLDVPLTANVWNMRLLDGAASILNEWQNLFIRLDASAVVVDDVYTYQCVQQLWPQPTHLIPLVFDYDKFTPLPTPDAPFTVGVFGNNYVSKRFDIVEEACKLAEVEYYPCITSPSRTVYNLDPVRDVYSRVHMLAHASILDTNSMPVREALLCGRPVVCTVNGGLMRVVRDDENGFFFDGSVDDLAEKICAVRDDYANMAQHARDTRLESVEESVKKYDDMWERVADA